MSPFIDVEVIASDLENGVLNSTIRPSRTRRQYLGQFLRADAASAAQA
jgi:hypothetical protein